MDKYEVNILYYLRILNKWKWFIGLLIFVATAYAMIMGLKSPRIYKAEVTFLVTGAGAPASQIGSLLGIPSLSGGGGTSGLVITIIKSRRMAEDVVEKFFSETTSSPRSLSRAIKRIQKMIKTYAWLDIGRAIEISDEDPKLAADIANFCVANIDVINTKLALSSEKPLVKVIDPAEPPLWPESRGIKKKMVVASLFAGLGSCIMAFFVEYIKAIAVAKREA